MENIFNEKSFGRYRVLVTEHIASGEKLSVKTCFFDNLEDAENFSSYWTDSSDPDLLLIAQITDLEDGNV